MRILVDHPVDHILAEIFDSNIMYRSELAGVSEHILGRELARIRPDVLLTRRALGGVAARSWKTACSQPHLIVVRLGRMDTFPPDGLPAGIITRFVAPSANSFLEALAVAENAWIEAGVTADLATGRVHARAARGRSVAMVGAGVVNLVTALRLVREGYAMTVYERSPDPRVDAPWKDYGCTRGGGDARMFTLTEADGYYFGTHHKAPDSLRTPIRDGGWRIAGPAALSDRDLEWASTNAAVPPWLSRSYTNDILLFNRSSSELWQELMRAERAAFDNVGLRTGILRLYTDEQHLHRQIARHERVGASPLVFTPDQLVARHPALGDAVRGQGVAGGIGVPGFTVQAHAFLSRLVDLLEQSGVRFFWSQEVSQLRRDGNGDPSGLWVADNLVVADHLVLSTGVYGSELLRGTASDGLIHGVLGVWLTLPGGDPALEHSLKISRRGHRAEDANVTVTNGPDGEPLLIIGSGYGWTGHDPNNIDAEELAVLYDAVEDTARTFFPRAFSEARKSGLLERSRRFCVRPWTASSLGILEIAKKSDGGIMIITGGHNTGGFAQAPVVAEAISAALRGEQHPMHTLYHPDRLRAFLRARRPEAVNIEEQSLQRRCQAAIRRGEAFMDKQSWGARGDSFGRGTEAYEQSRPGYTVDTVRWILGDRPIAVLDLGAGTGQLTRQLITCGHATTAVEPDPAMLARLVVTTPQATALNGCAEDIPVPDASQDALLISHAYHWFDPESAHHEFARVIRPGGVLAALWNLRDEEIPWSAELSAILRDEDTGADPTTSAAIMRHGTLAALRSADGASLSGWLANPSFGSAFGPITQRFFPNSTRHTAQTLVDLVKSRSYYLTSTPERQAELESRVRTLATSHPDLAGHQEFDLHYVTVVFRAERLPGTR